MRLSLKNIITPSIPLAIFSILACFSLWLFAYAQTALNGNAVQHFTAITYQWDFLNNIFISNLISIVFTLTNAFLITQLNNKFTIIRSRTFLPILIFVLLMCTWSDTHLANESDITVTLFLFSLFYLLDMYRNPVSVEQAFMGCVLIGISSIIINFMIVLLPIIWIGFAMFQSLSLRTFLASIFGILTPWIFYVSGAYFFNPELNFVNLFNFSYTTEFDLNLVSLRNLIYIGSLVTVFLICLFGLYSNSRADATHTRVKLNYLLLLIISISILSLVFIHQFVVFLPIIGLLYSMLVSHAFTLKQNDFYSIVFIVFCAINILFVFTKYVV